MGAAVSVPGPGHTLETLGLEAQAWGFRVRPHPSLHTPPAAAWWLQHQRGNSTVYCGGIVNGIKGVLLPPGHPPRTFTVLLLQQMASGAF